MQKVLFQTVVGPILVHVNQKEWLFSDPPKNDAWSVEMVPTWDHMATKYWWCMVVPDCQAYQSVPNSFWGENSMQPFS